MDGQFLTRNQQIGVDDRRDNDIATDVTARCRQQILLIQKKLDPLGVYICAVGVSLAEILELPNLTECFGGPSRSNQGHSVDPLLPTRSFPTEQPTIGSTGCLPTPAPQWSMFINSSPDKLLHEPGLLLIGDS